MNNLEEKICPNCASPLKNESNSFICEYCDSKFTEDELDDKRDNNIISTDINVDKATRLIPFTISKEEFLNSIKKITKGKLFIPSIFKKINLEDIKIVYVPVYTFDIKSEGDTLFKCTDISAKVKDDNKIISVKKYKTTVNSKVDFAKTLECANKEFDCEILNKISDYNSSDLIEISDLNNALETNISFSEALKKVSFKCRKQINDLIMKKTEHMYSVIDSNDIKFNLINAEIIYLPIYYVEKEYLNKKYYFKMNGKSGVIDYDFPISNNKMIILTSLVFLVTAIIFSLVFFLGGAK